MLVRLTFGASRGEVIDFPPHEASAMLADGRAVSPDTTWPPDVPVLTNRVEARTDRGMPRTKARRHR